MKRVKKEFDLLMPNRVSLWKRAFAFIIDLFIIYLATSPLQVFLANEIGIEEKFDINALKELLSDTERFEKSSNSIIAVVGIIALLALVYWSILEYFLKQSIGKMIMKISIRSQTGELKIWQAITRNVTKAASTTSHIFVAAQMSPHQLHPHTTY